jgi:hypothetical protein
MTYERFVMIAVSLVLLTIAILVTWHAFGHPLA